MAPLLPTLAAHARSLITSAVTARSQAAETASNHLFQLGPLAARAVLLARDDNNKDQGQGADPQALDPTLGVTDPNDINNTFIFVLFGLIGVAFVITGIWFFFWAKNGGFYFKEDDWEDYKSTVLRRKGPNGTLLSNATPSTNLGGGSVYKDVDDGTRTEYTGGLTQMTGDTADTSDTISTLTGITAGASDIAGRERRRRAREKKEREHEKKRDRKQQEKQRSSRRKVGEDGVLVDEEAEADAKRNLRAYRGERAARVGGLNKEPEGSEWDGSTNPEMSTVSGSELLLSNRQGTPTSTPTKDKRRSNAREYYESTSAAAGAGAASEVSSYVTESQAPSQVHEKTASASAAAANSSSNNNNNRKAGGIRKVYSTADRTTNRENERLRAEARRLAQAEKKKSRAAGPPSSLSSSSSSSAGPAHHPSTSRRDYNYQRADLRNPASAIAEEREEREAEAETPLIGTGRYLPAPPQPQASSSWVPESDIGDGSDLGTKAYRHYIPGISSSVGPGSDVVDGSEGAAADDRRERRRWRDAQRSRRE
ncbi:hypothetical protein F5B17DRAFT_265080 [Nemania serpens]|nr:hypothetical protein F5B17DRAFT_265080 [Nemania serpens]